MKKKKVDIVRDSMGNQVVVLNEIRLSRRKKINWDKIEAYLKQYVGQCVEITETSDLVYIGKDFPDEYVHSKDTRALRGNNLYAKINATSVVLELLQIASNKSYTPNYKDKHREDACFGWYRYDTRFAVPVYDNEGELCRYNVYKARVLIRHDKDGNLYLYDLLRIKKETDKPLEQ